MRHALLIIGLLSALINSAVPRTFLYIVSAIALFLWFYARGIDEPATEGEKFCAVIAIIGCFAAFTYMIQNHTGAAGLAFYITSTVIVSALVFSKK